MIEARTYERRMHESIRGHGLVEPQQRPRPELPTRCVVTVNTRGISRHSHLLIVGRRIGGELILSGKVAGHAPDSLDVASDVIGIEDKIPIVVFAEGTGVNVPLQTSI
jgi:hypothetical protein